MSRNQISDAGKILAAFAWRAIERTSKFPSRHAAVVHLDEAGFKLSDAADVVFGISTSIGAETGESEVPVNAEALATIPDARVHLEPSWRAIRALIERLVASPHLPNHEVTVPWSELRQHWPSGHERLLLAILSRGGAIGPLRSGGASAEGEFHFKPGLDALRYEHVQSLDDVFREESRRARRISVGDHPSGKHRALLIAAFSEASQTLRWPESARFALEHRSIGFVPDLRLDLEPRFVSTNHQVIKLKSRAVFSVDPSGEGRELLTRSVRAIQEHWRASGSLPISLETLAQRIGASPTALRPWLLFLEDVPWRSGTLGELGNWQIGASEWILSQGTISTWEQYVAFWEDEFYRHRAELPEASEQRIPTFDLSALELVGGQLHELLMSTALVRLVSGRLQELARAINAELWLSSLLLCGSILESVLLDVVSRNPGRAQSILKNKWPERTSLDDLLNLARDQSLLVGQIVVLAQDVRLYRDLIHPHRATVTAIAPSAANVRTAIHVLEQVVDQLHHARVDGRIAAYEA